MTDKLADVARAICKAESTGMDQGQTCDCDGKTQRYHYIVGEIDEMRDRPCPYRNEAKAAIEAHEAALEAQGLVIVPREPNPNMIFAGQTPQHTLTGYDNIHLTECSVEKRYKAMLAALEGK